MVSWSDLQSAWNPVTRKISLFSLAKRDLDLARADQVPVARVQLQLERVLAWRQRQAQEIDLPGKREPAAGVGALRRDGGDVDQQPQERRAAGGIGAGGARPRGPRVPCRHP